MSSSVGGSGLVIVGSGDSGTGGSGSVFFFSFDKRGGISGW